MDYRGVVVDLDGTVYEGKTLIPGVSDAIETLRERGASLLFLTNNPTLTRESYVERLDAMGVRIEPEELLSAGTVTTRYLVANHATDTVFVIGSSGLCEQFEHADIEMTDDPDAADVVVTSYDHSFGYEDLADGLWALDSAEAFVATDPDVVYPNDNGRPLPGSGAITNAIAGVAGRNPDVVLGKPASETVDVVLETLDHHPDDYLIVGDKLDTDITFGERAGMTTALVRSGISDQASLAAANPQPDHVIDTLADINTIL